MANYVYKMVQVPPRIKVIANKQKGNEAADYLEAIANQYANEGWEFYRIDSIGIDEMAGCFGSMTNSKVASKTYHVITFRKER